MKTQIYARVIAVPVEFPDQIGMRYVCLNGNDRPSGEEYSGTVLDWERVKMNFWIDAVYAEECERIFADGKSAFLGNRQLTGKFYESGESGEDS